MLDKPFDDDELRELTCVHPIDILRARLQWALHSLGRIRVIQRIDYSHQCGSDSRPAVVATTDRTDALVKEIKWALLAARNAARDSHFHLLCEKPGKAGEIETKLRAVLHDAHHEVRFMVRRALPGPDGEQSFDACESHKIRVLECVRELEVRATRTFSDQDTAKRITSIKRAYRALTTYDEACRCGMVPTPGRDEFALFHGVLRSLRPIAVWIEYVGVLNDRVDGLFLFCFLDRRKDSNPDRGANGDDVDDADHANDGPDFITKLVEFLGRVLEVADAMQAEAGGGGMATGTGEGRSIPGDGYALPAEGDWSEPMTKAEMARRYFQKDSARGRQLDQTLVRYGLHQSSERKWHVRLDTMDRQTRRRMQTPHGGPDK